MSRRVTLFGVVLALVLSSCGGDDDDSTPPPADRGSAGSPPTRPPNSSGELPPDLRKCLADQGIDVPPPGEPPTGIDPLQAQHAIQACAEFLPPGVAP